MNTDFCSALNNLLDRDALWPTHRTGSVSVHLCESVVTYMYMDIGKGREHDCMDAGDRATQELVAEERKLSQHYTN